MKKLKLTSLLLLLCLSFSLFAPGALALEDPEINAQAAVVVDMNSGRVLFQRNMDEQRSMASLTKIMTGLLAIEAVESGEHSFDEMVTAGSDCTTGMDQESSTANILPGEQMSYKDLLYCALLHSGNDACNVIATHISGSIEAFVELMNQRAAELGCSSTVFADPNGLSQDNKTSAYDLYLISKAAMSYEDFALICDTETYTVPATNMSAAREYHNSNALISAGSPYGGSTYLYDYASGVKTGYTRAAGYCLVSTATKDDMSLLAVVLGCDGWLNAQIEEYKNFEDSITLYDWVFNNFSYHTVLSSQDPIERAPVKMAKDTDTVILSPREDVMLLLPGEVDSSSVSTNVTIYEDKLTAPIAAGTVLGEARIIINGQDYGSVELVNQSAVELAGGQQLLQRLKEIFSKGWVIALILVLLIVGGIYLALLIGYKRMLRRHMEEKRLRAQRRREEARRLRQNQPPQEPEAFDEEDFWR